jgi:hypothetical protein
MSRSVSLNAGGRRIVSCSRQRRSQANGLPVALSVVYVLGLFAGLGVIVYVLGGLVLGARLAFADLPGESVFAQLPREFVLAVVPGGAVGAHRAPSLSTAGSFTRAGGATCSWWWRMAASSSGTWWS